MIFIAAPQPPHILSQDMELLSRVFWFLWKSFLMKEGLLLPLSMYGLAYHESLNAYLGKTHKGEVNFVDKDISMTGR